ncbi:hypothetical protein KKC1_06310 [Calderihabitans maritimus]|uniref:Uncharacterized protein n=3 Tax=Calderihabitans maritimus TaxID=1246530 RepID=A0A1Z5HPL7_9FIRM|nr:hypothetical protein KKC1_06310 [Calderihabitans maritimus]
MKLTVSDAASKQLAGYKGKNIRIFISGIG